MKNEMGKPTMVYVVANDWADGAHCAEDRQEAIFANKEEAHKYFKEQVAFDKKEGLGMQADKFPADYDNDNLEEGDIVIAEDSDCRYYVFEEGYAACNYVEISCEEREIR